MKKPSKGDDKVCWKVRKRGGKTTRRSPIAYGRSWRLRCLIKELGRVSQLWRRSLKHDCADFEGNRLQRFDMEDAWSWWLAMISGCHDLKYLKLILASATIRRLRNCRASLRQNRTHLSALFQPPHHDSAISNLLSARTQFLFGKDILSRPKADGRASISKWITKMGDIWTPNKDMWDKIYYLKALAKDHGHWRRCIHVLFAVSLILLLTLT